MREYDNNGGSLISKGPATSSSSGQASKKRKEPIIKSVSAWEMLHENQRRASSFPLLMQPHAIDATAGRNGAEEFGWMRLPPGLHEIAGEGGAGKSQVAMSLSVDVASDALGPGSSPCPRPCHPSSPVYYVSMRSTAKFVERLHQMVHARGASPAVLQRILIREVSNVESLLELLTGLLQANYSTLDHIDNNSNSQHKKGRGSSSSSVGAVPPRLVVLDSVADLIRGEEAPAPGKGWSTYAALRRVARLLRTFSERHRVAVLCVNQVTANVGTGTLKPALGLTWAQEMDRSYMVSKRAAVPASASSEGTENAPGLATNQLRTIELSRSSQFGPHQAQFTVQAWGISMMPT
jgi:RecA/RadA recombinase